MSAECGVRSAEFEEKSAECGVRSAEFEVRSAECGVRSAELEDTSAECGVRSAELEDTNAEYSALNKISEAQVEGFVYPLVEEVASMLFERQGAYSNLKDRTKQYALRIFRFARSLPDNAAGKMIQGQIVRAGGSVAANYRAACRAKSTNDFIYKMGIVEEETDETMLWMELAVEDGLISNDRIKELYREGDEILSIVIQSIRTAKQGKL